MYYSLTFSYDRPTAPLFFSKDNRTYGLNQNTRKNTWIDWHLVPAKRPSINTPERKTKIVEIPGMNGDLDLSESLTGYPLYSNRKGSIEFLVMNDYEHWHDIYQNMCSYLHGKRLYMAFEEDPAYYYYGTFTVEQYESGDNNSNITISYELEPFKYEYLTGNVDGGYWDIFDFNTDVINGVKYTDKFDTVEIDSEEYVPICSGYDWGNYTELPIMPTITINTNEITDAITIHFVNEEMGIDFVKTLTGGTYKLPQIIFTQNKNVGKVRYQYGIAAVNDGKPTPIYYHDMGYGTTSMILEAKGHGTIKVNAIPGRK